MNRESQAKAVAKRVRCIVSDRGVDSRFGSQRVEFALGAVIG